MPGVEVRSEHDDFAGLICSWDLTNDVEGVQIVVVELVLNVHLERDRKPLLHVTHQNAVMLGSKRRLCRHGRSVHSPIAPALNEHCSACNASGGLAWSQQSKNSFIDIELVSLNWKGLLFGSLLLSAGDLWRR